MDPDDPAERDAVLGELLQLQRELESSAIPGALQPMLELQLTVQQLKVLAIVVTETRGGSIQSLARTVGVSLATMSGIVDRLASQAMIERSADSNDQRVRRVVATERGRETVQHLLAARPELGLPLLSRLSLDDLHALVQGVRALMNAVREGVA
ncbi:MarR family transcriptional regulator [Agrococcus sp. KRD186]|uniref:MarR family transcriptional regulator n=1 Tax=Agrococcus sp. KRD186 TaxID=2729730 RepID=UPI0019D03CD6